MSLTMSSIEREAAFKIYIFLMACVRQRITETFDIQISETITIPAHQWLQHNEPLS